MLTLDALLVAPFVGLVDVTDGAASIVKSNEMSGPGWSGGSFVSLSETLADVTVKVHSSPAEKSVSGLTVHVMLSLVLSALVCEPELAHEMETVVMVTASVHVMLMFVLAATLAVFEFGDV